MSGLDIALSRLYNQRIAQTAFEKPHQAVSWFGAMQAQDFESAKWAVGLRCVKIQEEAVLGAINNGEIVRSWLNRGTLHITIVEDIRWMLALLAPGIISRSRRRYKELELDQATFNRSFELLKKALLKDKRLPRAELLSKLDEKGLSTEGQRGYHILRRAGLEGLICFGPPQGNSETFVLLDEMISERNDISEEEAIAELSGRYFQSHGPATIDDFIWWSGLPAAKARAGLDMNKAKLNQELRNGKIFWLPREQVITSSIEGFTHLLPAYDEYILGYKGRSFILDPEFDKRAVSNNGVFRPVILIDGQVVGTWKRSFKNDSVNVTIDPFTALTETDIDSINASANRLGAFYGLSGTLV